MPAFAGMTGGYRTPIYVELYLALLASGSAKALHYGLVLRWLPESIDGPSGEAS